MAGGAQARRYSQAVFEIALETKELDRWQSDLQKIVSVVGDVDFKAALESPRFPAENKEKLLSERLKGIDALVLNLLRLLMDRGKLDIISDITAEYQHLLNSYRGVESAKVTSAIPIDDEEKTKLAKYLGEIVGKEVVLTSEVDPGLIGGITARIGGKLLDGSTRSKLAALKREMVGAERKY